MTMGDAGRRWDMRWRGITVAVIVIVACLIALGLVSDFLVDWLWFSAVGYFDVFWTILGAKAVLFVAVFAVSTVALWVNGALASRFARRLWPWLPAAVGGRSASGRTLPETLSELFGPAYSRLPWRFVVAGVAVILGTLIAAVEAGNWDVALRFVYQAPYGLSDPLYGKDIGFYLFSLPAYVALKNWALTTLVLSAFVAGAVYWAHGDIMLEGGRRWMSSAAVTHGSALLGLFFAVKAWSYVLDRFLLLYGDNGVVVGAGYTDVHVELPVLWLLVGLATAASVASMANMRWRSYRIPAASVLLVFGSSFVFALIYPALFQRFYVKPSELQLETPYIEHNIALTREAYGLKPICFRP